MPYIITNLLLTRNDPFRRNKVRGDIKRSVNITGRVLAPGQSINISDALYERVKTSVARYLTLGMITCKQVAAITNSSLGAAQAGEPVASEAVQETVVQVDEAEVEEVLSADTSAAEAFAEPPESMLSKEDVTLGKAQLAALSSVTQVEEIPLVEVAVEVVIPASEEKETASATVDTLFSAPAKAKRKPKGAA